MEVWSANFLCFVSSEGSPETAGTFRPSCIAKTQKFQILYRNEEVDIGEIFIYRVHTLVESTKVMLFFTESNEINSTCKNSNERKSLIRVNMIKWQNVSIQVDLIKEQNVSIKLDLTKEQNVSIKVDLIKAQCKHKCGFDKRAKCKHNCGFDKIATCKHKCVFDKRTNCKQCHHQVFQPMTLLEAT